MGVTRMVVERSPEEVFAILSDPESYPGFVVGSRHVRDVEGNWPDPDARFHHSLGLAVTVIRDLTSVVACEPPNRLQLHTAMGPLGANRTEFRLRPHPRGTLVELEERPTHGFVALPGVRWLVTGMLWMRNHEVLRRFRHAADAPRDTDSSRRVP